MAGETNPIIKIDVDDSAFKAFQKTFEEFKQTLQNLPTAFARIKTEQSKATTEAKKSAKELADAEKARAKAAKEAQKAEVEAAKAKAKAEKEASAEAIKAAKEAERAAKAAERAQVQAIRNVEAAQRRALSTAISTFRQQQSLNAALEKQQIFEGQVSGAKFGPSRQLLEKYRANQVPGQLFGPTRRMFERAQPEQTPGNQFGPPRRLFEKYEQMKKDEQERNRSDYYLEADAHIAAYKKVMAARDKDDQKRRSSETVFSTDQEKRWQKFTSSMGVGYLGQGLTVGAAVGSFAAAIDALRRLMELTKNVAEERRAASQIGVNQGTVTAAQTALARLYSDPKALLSRVAQMGATETDTTLEQIGIQNKAKKSPAQLLQEAHEAARKAWEKSGHSMATMQALGFTNIFTPGEIIEMGVLSQGEQQQAFKDFEEQSKKLQVAAPAGKRAADITQNIESLKNKIRSKVINTLFGPGGATEFLGDLHQNALIPTDKETTGRAKKVMSILEKGGLSHKEALLFTANLMGESSTLNAAAVGDNGQAFGIAQWHKDRQKEFEKFAGHSIKGSTLEEQAQFILYELQHKERASFDKLKSAQSDAEKLRAIIGYERPADPEKELNRRWSIAQRLNRVVVDNGSDNAVTVQVRKQPGGNSTENVAPLGAQ